MIEINKHIQKYLDFAVSYINWIHHKYTNFPPSPTLHSWQWKASATHWVPQSAELLLFLLLGTLIQKHLFPPSPGCPLQVFVCKVEYHGVPLVGCLKLGLHRLMFNEIDTPALPQLDEEEGIWIQTK
jgi:hypothetical protein